MVGGPCGLPCIAVGIPAWIWFVIAAVAAVAGLVLLTADRARESSRNRERARWAELRGWQYVEEDERLPHKWTGGAIGYFGAQSAVNVVAGSTFTTDGRRPVFVFDIEADNVIPAVIVAVRCNRVHPVLLELWLASVPFQRAEMPELLGPVGQRYAFADDLTTARALINQDLVDAADSLGGDVGVAWLEDEWVLASVAPAGPVDWSVAADLRSPTRDRSRRRCFRGVSRPDRRHGGEDLMGLVAAGSPRLSSEVFSWIGLQPSSGCRQLNRFVERRLGMVRARCGPAGLSEVRATAPRRRDVVEDSSRESRSAREPSSS